MLGRVLTIALNTYREAVRARILLGLAGVAFCVSAFSLVIASFTLNSAPRVVSDLGAASISLFSVIVAVVIGATTLYRELEQKTIFPILARPISRGEYVVGKYAGILLTIFTFIAADTGLVLMLCAALGKQSPTLIIGVFLVIQLGWVLGVKWPGAWTFGPIPWAVVMLVAGVLLSGGVPDERRVVLTQALLSFLEVGIVAAIALLMSSFSTPFLSALLTVGLWIVGRSSDSLARFPKKFFGPAAADFFKALGKVVPNLHVYVPPRPLLTGEAADVNRLDYMLLAALTAIGWAIGLLAVASFVFKRRDFL
ncbi:MAG: ABC transporter permease [Polyangiaceae bacterium]|nr:ABC transporter permease [Polyangiaceae bacterium]